MKKRQSDLFKVQLWHLRKALHAELYIRKFEKRITAGCSAEVRELLEDSIRTATRSSKLHRKFMDAITPFVKVPIPNTAAKTTCPCCRHGLPFNEYCRSCELSMRVAPYFGPVRT